MPTLHRTVVDYANFDHAASTPALESVKAAVDVALRTYSSVHRGAGYASKVTSGWYEEARAEVGAFVGARADDLVVFTRNTTDSLNLLGRSLPRDTTTFVFETEHHAALLPWNPRRTVRLPVPGSVEDALVLLGDALAASPDGPRLVVVTGASNVTGELWPVDQVVALARQHGARVALDAAQLAPHRRRRRRRARGRLRRLLRPQALRPVRRRRAGRPRRLARRRVAVPARRRRHGAGDSRGGPLGRGRRPARGRHPQRRRRDRARGGLRRAPGHREAVEAHEDALATGCATGLGAIRASARYSLFGEDHPASASSPSPSTGWTARWCRRPCPPSTASASATASSARTCWSTPCWTTPPRAPRSGPASGLANTAEHVDRLLRAVATLAATGPAFDYALTADGWVPAQDPRDLSLPRPW